MAKSNKHVFQETYERPYHIITAPPEGDTPRLYVTGVVPLMDSDMDEDHEGIDDLAGIAVEIDNGIPHIEYFRNLSDAVYVLKHIRETYDEEVELQELLGDADFPFRIETIEPKLHITQVSDSDLLVADLERGDAGAGALDFFGIKSDPWTEMDLLADLEETHGDEVEAKLAELEDRDDDALKAFLTRLVEPKEDD